MCLTEDNRERVQWAARTEGDNVRRETKVTTEYSLGLVTWVCNKNKRGKREKLQHQLRTTMKEQYKQEIAAQNTQSNKDKRTNKRNQKEIQRGKGGDPQKEKKATKENEQDKAGGQKEGDDNHGTKGKPGQGNKFIIAKQTITKPERHNIRYEERANRQTRKGTHSPTKTRNGTVRGTVLVFGERLERITGRNHTTHIVTEVTETQTTQLREQRGKTWTAYEGNFIIRIGEGELIQLPEGDTIIFGKRNKQEEREEAKETIILVKTSAQAQIMVSDQEER
jgi:mannose-6-phosphate isomerase-like protein (cupin superfamily)